MIRRAEIEDLCRLEDGAKAFFSSSRHLHDFEIDKFVAVWSDIITRDIGVVFVIEHDGLLVGALGGLSHKDLYGDKLIATEMFWFVLPEFRGGGMRLFMAFEKWAKEKGCCRIMMAFLLDLMPEKLAIAYRRRGYVPSEVFYSKEIE